ncbi:MAG: hypothetical protein ACOVO9_11020 [Bacteroidia bacterium]
MKIKILSIFALLGLFAFESFAQEKAEVPAAKPEKSNPYSFSFGTGWALGVKAGTAGYGGELSKKLSRSFDLRLGYAMLATAQSLELDVDKRTLAVDADIALGIPSAKLDWHPGAASFRFTFGAGMPNNNIGITGQLKESFTYGEIVVKPEELGVFNMDIKWNAVAPYLGIGFGRNVPKKRVSFTIDMGAYHIGSPKVTLNPTGMISPTADQASVFEGNMVDYKWHPVLNFQFNVKIN